MQDIGLLLVTELKVLAPGQRLVRLVFADGALKAEDHLLGGLGLLVEHGLRLPTVPALLPVVATLALRKLGGLPSLVLGHLVESVLAALLRRAKGVPGLRHDHLSRNKPRNESDDSTSKNQAAQASSRTWLAQETPT